MTAQPTEIKMNGEITKSTSVEELQQYIQYLHTWIPTLHKNQKTLFDFGEKMIEKHKKQKLEKDALLEMCVKEKEINEDSVGLVKQLTLKYRKQKKKKIALNDLLHEKIEELYEKIEKLKQEKEGLKERLKQHLSWRERAKMEEMEEMEENED